MIYLLIYFWLGIIVEIINEVVLPKSKEFQRRYINTCRTYLHREPEVEETTIKGIISFVIFWPILLLLIILVIIVGKED